MLINVDLLNVKRLWFGTLAKKNIELGEKNGKERHHFHDIHLHGAYSHFIGSREPIFWGEGVIGEKSESMEGVWVPESHAQREGEKMQK